MCGTANCCGKLLTATKDTRWCDDECLSINEVDTIEVSPLSVWHEMINALGVELQRPNCGFLSLGPCRAAGVPTHSCDHLG